MLTNKIVFITGASSGIGQASAKLFAASGAKLLLCARRIEELTSFADSLKKEFGVAVHAFKLDIREAAQVKKTLYCATRPPHVNIDEIIIMPRDQASAVMISRANK